MSLIPTTSIAMYQISASVPSRIINVSWCKSGSSLSSVSVLKWYAKAIYYQMNDGSSGLLVHLGCCYIWDLMNLLDLFFRQYISQKRLTGTLIVSEFRFRIFMKLPQHDMQLFILLPRMLRYSDILLFEGLC